MFKLRNEQLQVLEAWLDTRLERWIVEHVRLRWGHRLRGVSDAETLKIVRAATRQARDLGLTCSSTVAGYTNLVMLLGPRLADDERIPFVGALLRSTALSDHHKLRAIGQRIRELGLQSVDRAWGWS